MWRSFVAVFRKEFLHIFRDAGTLRLALALPGQVEVRTGNASATYFTVNGTDVGRLSKAGNPGTWRFEPGAEPVRTDGQ